MTIGDRSLKVHIERELEGQPDFKAAAIGVSVMDAVVTLSGEVESYHEKQSAASVVRQIRGLRGFANEIVVKPSIDGGRADQAIALAAAQILAWDARVSTQSVRLDVSDGWITLHGEVSWYQQRWAAEDLVSHLLGVRGVSNQIIVNPRQASDRRSRSEALAGDCEDPTVTMWITNDQVEIQGTVASLCEKVELEMAIWNVPGISYVQSQLTVKPMPSA